MSKNKLYNRSYFSKRLIQSGFEVTKLDIHYQKDDFRKWTIVVNPSSKINCYRFNTLVTCYKDDETKDYQFKFQGQNIEDFTLKTKSMKLIIKIFQKTVELFDPNISVIKQKDAFNHNSLNELTQEDEKEEEEDELD